MASVGTTASLSSWRPRGRCACTPISMHPYVHASTGVECRTSLDETRFLTKGGRQSRDPGTGKGKSLSSIPFLKLHRQLQSQVPLASSPPPQVNHASWNLKRRSENGEIPTDRKRGREETLKKTKVRDHLRLCPAPLPCHSSEQPPPRARSQGQRLKGAVSSRSTALCDLEGR